MLIKLNRCLTGVSIFLTMAGLIAGMAGCTYNPPSQNLEIRTWYDLDAVRDNLAGNHTLMNDLDSTTPGYTELASAAANGGKGWQPIGNLTGANYTFAGTFDGQGYEIRDLFINRPDERYVGLFCAVKQGGVIKDISVMNVTASGYRDVGGLAGTISDCTISNSYSSGNVTGYVFVGGLIGANAGTVSKCYSTGGVTGTAFVGGLVGENGLVHESNNRYAGTVRDSYYTGSVTGVDYVGGLVGDNYDSVVSNSYSAGSVTGGNFTGGLVGTNGGNVTNSFWDIQTSGQPTSDGGTGKNTTEMQDIATFSGAGWSIAAVVLNETNPAYIWNIVHNVTYPFLSWQP